MKLYTNLLSLCEGEDSSFYFKDFTTECDVFYRVFLYRLASYTEFCKEGALESRGIMFLVKHDGSDVRLVCRPPEKFFNVQENLKTNYTLEELHRNTADCMNKEDGSLISSYIDHNDLLRLKTKGSLTSVQALDSIMWLSDGANRTMKNAIARYTRLGFTVNMEWTAPHNRIVLGYTEPKLIVLNIRCNQTGDYLSHRRVKFSFPNNSVKLLSKDNVLTYREQEGIEGYVVRLKSGQQVKLKTNWYVNLHRNKDNVSTPRKLFEACLDEVTDDLKQMFETDEEALKLINDMEEFAKKSYNALVNCVESFYNTNSFLERKDYAILGQQELNGMEFGLAMMLYSGKEPDYKKMLKKAFKEMDCE